VARHETRVRGKKAKRPVSNVILSVSLRIRLERKQSDGKRPVWFWLATEVMLLSYVVIDMLSGLHHQLGMS